MKVLFRIESKATDTQALIGKVEDAYILAFRSTNNSTNVITNLQARTKVLPYQDEHGNASVRVHKGFFKAYKSVRQEILDLFSFVKPSDCIITCGHSLGGALATLAAVDIQYNTGNSPILVTLGQPRVGNNSFILSAYRRVPRVYRYVLDSDLVPNLPPEMFGYAHHGQEIRVLRDLQMEIGLRDHRLEKYIEALKETHHGKTEIK